MPAFSEHPCHAAFKGIMHSLFERLIANFSPKPRPVPADRSPPLSTFRLGNGKEAQRGAYENNDDIAKFLGREEWKPNNLHCKWERIVERLHQDRNNETQDLVYGERDKNKWNDKYIVEGTVEVAFLGPCRVMII